MARKQIELSDSELATLKTAFSRAWGAVASDVEPDDNDEAVEICIDADRLETYGRSKEARLIVDRLANEHTYGAVLSFLSAKIRLV
jgi:hypothetical protein